MMIAAISKSISGAISGRVWPSSSRPPNAYTSTGDREGWKSISGCLLYFLAHFDVKARGFTDPVFLVPSPFFHKHALHGVDGTWIKFQFKASVEPDSRDMWAQWALLQDELGRRILHILNDMSGKPRLDPQVEQLIAMSGTFWLQRPSSIVVPKHHRAA